MPSSPRSRCRAHRPSCCESHPVPLPPVCSFCTCVRRGFDCRRMCPVVLRQRCLDSLLFPRLALLSHLLASSAATNRGLSRRPSLATMILCRFFSAASRCVGVNAQLISIGSTKQRRMNAVPRFGCSLFCDGPGETFPPVDDFHTIHARQHVLRSVDSLLPRTGVCGFVRGYACVAHSRVAGHSLHVDVVCTRMASRLPPFYGISPNARVQLVFLATCPPPYAPPRNACTHVIFLAPCPPPTFACPLCP